MIHEHTFDVRNVESDHHHFVTADIYIGHDTGSADVRKRAFASVLCSIASTWQRLPSGHELLPVVSELLNIAARRAGNFKF